MSDADRIELPDGVEMGEFKPCFIYNAELDLLQWIAEDTSTVAHAVGPAHAGDVLRDFEGKIVGLQIWGAMAAIRREMARAAGVGDE